ncbi:hypothetical protein SESBI_36443 [Sesbania bispinosa]|nr:hypothetical protein SESBI_36443 [Sesbania bispinosa]
MVKNQETKARSKKLGHEPRSITKKQEAKLKSKLTHADENFRRIPKIRKMTKP